MRRQISAALAGVFCLLTLAACGNPAEFSDGERLLSSYERKNSADVNYNYSDGAQEPPNSYNTYLSGAKTLALKQLRARYEAGKSFVFSPAATALQLGMLANAVSSDARQEILLSLGGISIDDLNACSSYFKSRMESVSADRESGSVKFGGAMLIDGGLDVKSSFLQTAKEYYDYDVLRFDYSGENAAKKLETYLKIGEAPELQADTVNLISTVSVKDVWLNASAEAPAAAFAGADGTKELPYYTADVKRLQSKKAVGVLRYTANNPLKLLLVMPDEGVSPDEYIKGFDTDELTALLESMDVTKDSAALIPDFEIAGGGQLSLSETLTKNGMYSLFTGKTKFASLSYTDSAKMGEMTEIAPGFTLDNNGVNPQNSKPKSPAVSVSTKDALTFNRPFLFLLLDNESDLPVLAGAFFG